MPTGNPTTSESCATSTAAENKIPDENLFDPIVLADIASNDLSESVWRLADQNDMDKDNQIFYVTYQDPNLGNKTMKLVNQMV